MDIKRNFPWKLVSRKPFSRIFCSTFFSEKLARTLFTVKLNFITKKSFCAERFEIVLNGYFFVLKRISPKQYNLRRNSITKI
ncbi:hypothetical protein BpHYR1_025521 [Brachionus plicatilis]|uniref:Uncharacterized protein n=1 Tax=Brachionus plicatilis TaxID=10195 RepID=A0A3M7RCD7_BRAPC|nr:hypothetical protein BpHYR1_025521 [Brachionus plicatilis]